MKPKTDWDVVELKRRLSYDPETGCFFWIVGNRKNRTGERAGSVNPCGYRVINIKNRLHREHRLAWLFVYGTIPSEDIDHINQDKSDNRIANLRLACSALNKQNLGLRADNKSGVRGVSWSKEYSKWVASIQVNYKMRMLGRFVNKEDAIAARIEAQQKYHPFSNADAR